MTNAEPIGHRAVHLQPSRDWLPTANLLAVVATQLVVLSIINSRFTKIENQIQASDTNRQADTRAINARMDNLQRRWSTIAIHEPSFFREALFF